MLDSNNENSVRAFTLTHFRGEVGESNYLLRPFLIHLRANQSVAVYIVRMQPRINPSDLSSEQKDALILQLFDQIAVLGDRIKERESQRSKNSHNSSKPPSSDGYGVSGSELASIDF